MTKEYKTDHAYVMKWAKKTLCVNRLGSKCSNCGEDDVVVLQFHHINAKEKEFDICENRGMHLEKLFKEVDKCHLLCANCHSELHQNKGGDNVNQRRRKVKEELLRYKGTDKCQRCNYKGSNNASLDLHHRIPAEKEQKPVEDACQHGMTKRVCDELDKCDVICKNCHTRTHIKWDKYLVLLPAIKEKVKNHIPRIKIDRALVLERLKYGDSAYKIAKDIGCSDVAIYYIKKNYLD